MKGKACNSEMYMYMCFNGLQICNRVIEICLYICVLMAYRYVIM